MSYKVESKGSLWEVMLQRGAYSDWDINFYVFSGNSSDEVWNYVKQWSSEGGTGDIDYCGKRGLVLVDDDYRQIDTYEFRKPIKDEGDINWDSGYGDAYKVKINRLKVIYVRDTGR